MTTPAPAGTPPIDLAPRDWADVVRILHEQVPAIEVWAFGSRARRTAKPYSDLDLALITQQPLSLEQFAAIADAFATSDLSIRVDLVDWAATSDAFRKLIAQDKVLVQAACT
jgi:type I restriction enzyme S subunit